MATNTILELTPKEKSLLLNLLSVDLDNIGYNEKEIDVLTEISYKLNPKLRPKPSNNNRQQPIKVFGVRRGSTLNGR